MLKFKLAGVRYDYDEEQLLISEAKEVKRRAGLTTKGYLAGVNELDGAAMQAMLYLAKKRAGEPVIFEDLESVNLLSDEFEWLDDEDDEPAAEGEGEQEADPTGATPTSTSTST